MTDLEDFENRVLRRLEGWTLNKYQWFQLTEEDRKALGANFDSAIDQHLGDLKRSIKNSVVMNSMEGYELDRSLAAVCIAARSLLRRDLCVQLAFPEEQDLSDFALILLPPMEGWSNVGAGELQAIFTASRPHFGKVCLGLQWMAPHRKGVYSPSTESFKQLFAYYQQAVSEELDLLEGAR